MKILSHIPYKLGTFILALVVLSGSIDMTPVSVTPYRNTYSSRFGYVMPTQGDYLVATWANPCTDFMIVTGAGDKIIFYVTNNATGTSANIGVMSAEILYTAI